jgi:hypothetical protein
LPNSLAKAAIGPYLGIIDFGRTIGPFALALPGAGSDALSKNRRTGFEVALSRPLAPMCTSSEEDIP